MFYFPFASHVEKMQSRLQCDFEKLGWLFQSYEDFWKHHIYNFSFVKAEYICGHFQYLPSIKIIKEF